MSDSAMSQAEVVLNNDLKVIPGISGKMEKRLNDAGIYSYAQLAQATEGELLAVLKSMPGYNLERVRSDNWSGQARQLDSQRTTIKTAMSEPEINVDENNHLPSERLPYASFMVQFSLDQGDRVRRINVHNVQKPDEKKQWATWEPGELAEFFEHSGEFKLASGVMVPEQQLDSASEAEVPQSVPKRSKDPGRITVIDWRIRAGDKLLKRLVAANQPFDFELDIYFNQVHFPPGEPLSCETTLFAREASAGQRLVIGRNEETLVFDNGSAGAPDGAARTVRTRAVLTEPGTYRFEAAVLIRPVTPAISLRYQAVGMLEGIVVQTHSGS